MSFEESYKKYNNIIHYLLKSYQITYNYDEFYQQMLIKMWQLTLDFDEQQSSSFKSYLFIRLKFYHIDLFRQKDTTLNICSIDTLSELSPSISINEIDLFIKEFDGFLYTVYDSTSILTTKRRKTMAKYRCCK